MFKCWKHRTWHEQKHTLRKKDRSLKGLYLAIVFYKQLSKSPLALLARSMSPSVKHTNTCLDSQQCWVPSTVSYVISNRILPPLLHHNLSVPFPIQFALFVEGDPQCQLHFILGATMQSYQLSNSVLRYHSNVDVTKSDSFKVIAMTKDLAPQVTLKNIIFWVSFPLARQQEQ